MKTGLILFSITFIFSHPAWSTTLTPSNLIISEVMANPSAVSDTNGEWFELFNASLSTIDINGFTLRDDGSNLHVIESNTSLLIQPGEYLVLGSNGDPVQNGGYIADYVYSDFSLTNSSDEIILLDGTNEIVRLEYTSGSVFGTSGISAELINQSLNPNQNDYALSLTTFGDGDLGTPGLVGSIELGTSSPVPIPGAIWLLVSGLLLIQSRNIKQLSNNIGNMVTIKLAQQQAALN